MLPWKSSSLEYVLRLSLLEEKKGQVSIHLEVSILQEHRGVTLGLHLRGQAPDLCGAWAKPQLRDIPDMA